MKNVQAQASFFFFFGRDQYRSSWHQHLRIECHLIAIVGMCTLLRSILSLFVLHLTGALIASAFSSSSEFIEQFSQKMR